jgi:hypothetical protein
MKMLLAQIYIFAVARGRPLCLLEELSTHHKNLNRTARKQKTFATFLAAPNRWINLFRIQRSRLRSFSSAVLPLAFV